MNTFRFFKQNNSGQSLVEVLIAVAVGAILITAAAGAIVPALRINTQTNRAQTGTALAKELLENVRVWAEGDWHNVSNLATSSAFHYYLITSSSPFSASDGEQSISVATTTFTRYFYIDDVYRNASDVLITSMGPEGASAKFDPSTKRVTVAYSWPQNATHTISEYITRNRNNVYIQTNWSGGPGQSGPATSTNKKFWASSDIDYTSTAGSLLLNLQ